MYATAPESLASLERSSDQDNSRSIRGAPQACFGFHEFSPFFMGKLVFCFHFLNLISWPIFVRERIDFARVTDWYPDVDWSRSSKLVKKKKCGKGLLLVGRRRGLESPRGHFRPQKSTKNHWIAWQCTFKTWVCITMIEPHLPHLHTSSSWASCVIVLLKSDSSVTTTTWLWSPL